MYAFHPGVPVLQQHSVEQNLSSSRSQWATMWLVSCSLKWVWIWMTKPGKIQRPTIFPSEVVWLFTWELLGSSVNGWYTMFGFWNARWIRSVFDRAVGNIQVTHHRACRTLLFVYIHSLQEWSTDPMTCSLCYCITCKLDLFLFSVLATNC